MSDKYSTTDEIRAAYFARKTGLGVHAMTHYPEFDRWLAAHDAEVAAKALEEAASAWQVSGWAHDLPEKGAERAQVILHMAQAATEMLRLRAAEYRKEHGNE